MEKQLDFVAIGDTVVDTFIRLSAAEEVWDVNHTTEKLCMSFADKVPYEFKEDLYGVGNSANAAVSASRLGLSTALITNLGDDQNGKDSLDSLHLDNVDTQFIKINQDKPTNHHYVLWFHQDRTILIKHEQYPYDFPTNIKNPKWIYLSSLGESSLPFHQTIAEFLKANSETKLVFQPGTYQIKFGTDALRDIYAHTELFFCNVEEAHKILNISDFKANRAEDVKFMMEKISELGPKKVVITDGPDGAYAFDGTDSWFMEAYPDQKPAYERTGAGDAFASTFTSALALGKTVGEALQWASINSMSVVQDVGAQKGLLSKEKLEAFLKEAKSDWNPKQI